MTLCGNHYRDSEITSIQIPVSPPPLSVPSLPALAASLSFIPMAPFPFCHFPTQRPKKIPRISIHTPKRSTALQCTSVRATLVPPLTQMLTHRYKQRSVSVWSTARQTHSIMGDRPHLPGCVAWSCLAALRSVRGLRYSFYQTKTICLFGMCRSYAAIEGRFNLLLECVAVKSDCN